MEQTKLKMKRLVKKDPIVTSKEIKHKITALKDISSRHVNRVLNRNLGLNEEFRCSKEASAYAGPDQVSRRLGPLPTTRGGLGSGGMVFCFLMKLISKYGMGKLPTATTREQLKTRIMQAWAALGEREDVLKNLCDSMPRRIKALVAAKGGNTKY